MIECIPEKMMVAPMRDGIINPLRNHPILFILSELLSNIIHPRHRHRHLPLLPEQVLWAVLGVV
jgi:hypothetical protein